MESSNGCIHIERGGKRLDQWELQLGGRSSQLEHSSPSPHDRRIDAIRNASQGIKSRSEEAAERRAPDDYMTDRRDRAAREDAYAKERAAVKEPSQHDRTLLDMEVWPNHESNWMLIAVCAVVRIVAAERQGGYFNVCSTACAYRGVSQQRGAGVTPP